jgi:hypothetical protein
MTDAAFLELLASDEAALEAARRSLLVARMLTDSRIEQPLISEDPGGVH